MAKKKGSALSEKKSPAEQAKAKGRKQVIKKVLKTFGSLVLGLAKVWHKNHSFIISEQDAVNLTLEQLEALVNEKESQKSIVD